MRPLLALAVLALVAVAARTTAESGATFVAKKSSAPSAVSSAADWSPPQVSLASPGTPLRGTVTLSATATDRDGIATVAFERSPAGAGAWAAIASDAAAPYSVAFDTTTVPDGVYDLRAVATDRINEVARSTVTSLRIDNTAPAVAFTDPGAFLRGTVTFAATASDAGTGVASVRLQRAAADTGNWVDLCTDTTAPYACTLDTTQISTDLYDLRALATDVAGNVRTSAVVADVQVDNVLPVVTMGDPGTPLSGTVTLTAAASDADAGIARVVIQRSAGGGTAWVDTCTVTTLPVSCRFDTTTVPDGLYELRAVATDLAGNQRTSVSVTGRRVDNTVSTVSMEDPGQFLARTVTLAASASATSGVAQVTIQYSPAGKAQWTAVCADSVAPFTCSLDTTTAATPNGLYDFRALMTNGAGGTFTSATVAARTIDNSPLSGYDVQALNVAGGSAGRMESGDRLLLWWTKPVLPGTLVSGWAGDATAAVWVRIADNAANGNDDQLSIFGDSTLKVTTGLGAVNMGGNYVRTGRSVVFASRVALASAQVNGAPASVATVTLGAPSTNGLRTWSSSGAMIWTPSPAATDAAGNKSSAAPVAETGAADRDF